ncbi:MAG TPA: PaaI family thioesterase [Dehalococcoidia bacterium]|nr:PaaI family thioesterase [Dehalococcoidia bacterium]
MNKEQLAPAFDAVGFGKLIGARVEEIEPDLARVVLPFRPDVVTFADIVHGGAIAGLLDIAATAAAWSTVEDMTKARGTTIGFSITYLEAARGKDVVAEARVIRRGKQIIYLEVELTSDGREVARGLVTYKLDLVA